MSTDTETETPPPAKKGMGMIARLLIGAVLLGAGGGGVFALMQAGIIGNAGAAPDNTPKLVRKGEKDPFAPPASGKDDGGPVIHGDGGSEYQTRYYSFAEDFTSNLKASDALVQVSLAASTKRDGRVLMWLKTHELAVRSSILTVLADTPEAEIHSIEGKKRLQQRLVAAINAVLTEQEGFGGVDAVLFRSFIVQ